nr:immunoglobulin heavy chain junction region [Macaca mulatta]MOX92210.1 immunoglobulin heavy chain junction region [Macaca mulatta]MOX93237.1 immunoglobulin heavy chain junction region [Macaca mulatta]MOX93356.1 immunoglobulin heavy chain junction region [Macaca mulatta]MOX93456.1 immunoglobulin heavy chain junction region [Macaca mulatta]
CARTSGSVW